MAGLLVFACEGGEAPATGADPTPAVDTAAPASEASPAAASGEVRKESIAGLRFEVPAAWESEAPASSMRVAQFRVPGDAGDASLVLFRFPGGGGSADANVARWIQQFEQTDGTPSEDRAIVERADANGLTLTTLDISGRFGGQQMPGAPEQPAIENARLQALVVEGSGDPYFFKLQGPAETVAQWAESWDRMVQSLEVQ